MASSRPEQRLFSRRMPISHQIILPAALDFQGDPLLDGGLEYLFGIVHLDRGELRFADFWAHDRDAERKAFENAVDFLCARLAECPDAHVYHYGAYEQLALKRLAMYHSTREFEVDNFGPHQGAARLRLTPDRSRIRPKSLFAPTPSMFPRC